MDDIFVIEAHAGATPRKVITVNSPGGQQSGLESRWQTDRFSGGV